MCFWCSVVRSGAFFLVCIVVVRCVFCFPGNCKAHLKFSVNNGTKDAR